MKRITAIALCTLMAAVMLTGCVAVNFSPAGAGSITGSGSMEKFTFDFGQINEIRVEMFCNVIYQPGSTNEVTFEVQPNLMDYITVEESGGILTVRSARGFNLTNTTNTPVLTVSSPSLSSVTHAGAGRFTTTGTITGDSFTLNITGAADGRADLDVQSLAVNLAGAGNFELSGIANTADVSMAGAGRLDALDLQTRSASITLAGVGTVRIGCSDELRINAGGVGTVEYRGSPAIDMTRGGLVTVRQVD